MHAGTHMRTRTDMCTHACAHMHTCAYVCACFCVCAHVCHSSAHLFLSKICTFLYFPVFCMLLEWSSSFNSQACLSLQQQFIICSYNYKWNYLVSQDCLWHVVNSMKWLCHNSGSCCQLFTADTKVLSITSHVTKAPYSFIYQPGRKQYLH